MIYIKRLLAFLALTLILGQPLLAETNAESHSNLYTNVYYIAKKPFRQIDNWTLRYYKNHLKDAEEQGADYILVELDTPGGRVDSALKIVDLLLDARARLGVYINKNAISAGALISLTGDDIFVNSASVFGASTPVYPGEGGQMVKAPEKMNSVLRAEFRSLAKKHGRNPDIAEAMVDEEIILTEKEHGIDLAEGKLLTLDSEEAMRIGMADYQVDTIEEVLSFLGSDLETVREKSEDKQGLQLLNVLSNPALLGILLSLGMLGLLTEITTQGWGVGGTLALIFLAAFFTIQIFLQDSTWHAPALFGVGVLLILFEVFFIPGFGVAGVLGGVAMLASVFLSFGIDQWQSAMMVVGIALLLFIPGMFVLFRYLPDSALMKRLSLQDTIKSAAVSVSETIKAGDIGKATTLLRPGGKAEFNDEIIDVQTQGDYLEEGTEVIITKMERAHAWVKKYKA